MRKYLQLLFAAVLTMTAFTAGGVAVGDLEYDLTTYANNLAVVTGLSQQGQSKTTLYLTIPSTITYNGTVYRVYDIKANAFTNATSIAGVDIKWGTRYITASAFQNCTNLTTVKLASSVDYIGAYAFSGCSKLKDVYYAGFQLPSTIGTSCFPSNNNMTLYVNKNWTTYSPISQNAEFKKFANHVINNDYAFDLSIISGNARFNLTIGKTDSNGASTPRDATVTYCVPLDGYNTVTGCAEVATVGESTRNITYRWARIGKYVTNADYSTPNSIITSIDLDNCTYLTELDNFAFAYNTALTTLKLPASLKRFYVNLCNGSSSLSNIVVNEENTSYSSYSGCLYNKARTALYRVPEGKSGSMSYPSTLLRLSADCHHDCKRITSALLPFGVLRIEDNAFSNCDALSTIRIPSSVQYIGDYTFTRTHGLTRLFFNVATPPTVDIAKLFSDLNVSNIDLYLPYGKISAYQNAGWTGFKSYNKDNNMAFDIGSGSDGYSECYTITSTADVTVNGTNYNGMAQLVGTVLSPINKATRTAVGYLVFNNKRYRVTSIGRYGFKSNVDFTVEGMNQIDSILNYAFYNQPLTAIDFCPTLSYIGNFAFFGTKATGTIAIPYGTRVVSSNAFGNGQYSRIIMPSSVISFASDFCKNTTTLTEMVVNNMRGSLSNWNFDFGTVPSTCKILVPTGYVNQFRNHPSWSSRASYIDAGAYDFVGYWGTDAKITHSVYNSSVHHFTVLSTASTTYNGTTYAGKVKYVYNPHNKSRTSEFGFQSSIIDQTCSTGHKTYLVTELGDSCLAHSSTTSISSIPTSVTRIGHDAFYNSKIANGNLALPEGLTYIGDYAFYDTQIEGEIKIPATVSTIGKYAFYHNKLNALYFPGAPTSSMNNYMWGVNANDFVCWVPNKFASEWYDKANAWGSLYSGKLAAWIKPDRQSMMFSSVLPVNLTTISAYCASSYSKADQAVTLTKVEQAPENTGLLLVDLVTGSEYRLRRPTSSVSAPAINYFVGTPSSQVNIPSQNVGYYWNGNATIPHWEKALGTYYTDKGGAFLKLSPTEAGDYTEIYSNLWPKPVTPGKKGDINNDGKIDIDDLNILVNILIGLDQASNYEGRANVDGIGSVDTGDINAMINIMLGID